MISSSYQTFLREIRPFNVLIGFCVSTLLGCYIFIFSSNGPAPLAILIAATFLMSAVYSLYEYRLNVVSVLLGVLCSILSLAGVVVIAMLLLNIQFV